MFRLWQDSHKSTQGWKVSFWRPVRGKFSVNIKMNNFVENILQNSFTPAVMFCYQIHAPKTDTYIHAAALLCHFRCHWCRNPSEVNCILHWIVLTLSTLQMGITLVIVFA